VVEELDMWGEAQEKRQRRVDSVRKWKELPARFECWRCGCEWGQKKGPTDCPQCGGFYVWWRNYTEA
jgi:rubrerythrin